MLGGLFLEWSFLYFLNSMLLGIGLAMDAFSVSIVDAFSDRSGDKRKIFLAAGVFAAFQAAMPMLGWLCVSTLLQYFERFRRLTPWIAFALLLYIGGKMLINGITRKKGEEKAANSFGTLLMQGVATSIDALSVGFTIAEYDLVKALAASAIISAVTFAICIAGGFIGRRFNRSKISEKADIIGGVILILIGAEILIKSFIK